MFPIAVVLVIGLSIAIERYIYLAHVWMRNRQLWNEIVPVLSQGNFRQVVQITSKSDSAIAPDPQLRTRPHPGGPASR